MISVEQFLKWIRFAHEKIQQHKNELTELDQAIGDGDHGVNLARGFEAVVQKLDAHEGKDLGALCQEIGMTLIAKVGGASGPLYGTAFVRMATAWKGKQSVTYPEFVQGIEAGANGIQARGKAGLGDKTMLDVWLPLADYLARETETVSWKEVERFVYQQMKSTESMEAKKGRAAFLGARSIGHRDPGAVSSYYLFAALCQTMEMKE
ncbi:dihydroxyacetone kinase subunit DhaL [Thermoflavimicrobium dichotomicum]|uniref:phosphoenolpyruvate--glycerone phosphotransferase n=1 Tax=Thermoflavimicrobium dichotomicum TaxID=46223 RepID=A0A1I3P1R4_9BACL|nr:dihydroxyacetone kinase subunit DhaL [Thermoflavimicrobium dichotomicum]SFJ15508.1 dihydroxyacetone kinase, C-terminal domain [Thermoflavimicrobium dichotomicum]